MQMVCKKCVPTALVNWVPPACICLRNSLQLRSGGTLALVYVVKAIATHVEGVLVCLFKDELTAIHCATISSMFSWGVSY
jgi:hypothetical protein